MFRETHFFEKGLGRTCEIESPHLVPISKEKIFYKP